MNTQPSTYLAPPTVPYFQAEAEQIAGAIREREDIAALMKVSPAIAAAVRKMYTRWGDEAKPAGYMYRGDVYKGFYADTLTLEDITWAQDHLLILSGLYGVLRPMDQISQYRLEMKAAIATDNAKNLYEFWGSKLAKYTDERSAGSICLLTSEEYARPIRKYSKSQLITPVFMDHKPNGKVGPVPIYSKMMRGVMARWVIDNRADTPEKLKEFTGFDYHYSAERSTLVAPVFVRDIMTPLVF